MIPWLSTLVEIQFSAAFDLGRFTMRSCIIFILHSRYPSNIYSHFSSHIAYLNISKWIFEYLKVNKYLHICNLNMFSHLLFANISSHLSCCSNLVAYLNISKWIFECLQLFTLEYFYICILQISPVIFLCKSWPKCSAFIFWPSVSSLDGAHHL